MNKDFTYREAVLQDIPQLINLGMLAYGQYAPELTDEHLADLKSKIDNHTEWANLVTISKSFTCTCKDKIIGMAFLVPSGHPWDIFKAEWSYIRLVGVDPAYQGQGIARTLMSMCMASARAMNEKTVALHTSEMMVAARHIYESMGFSILREIEPRLGKRYWIYTLDLTSNKL
jgi:ribosomal protein S18 acetylase RimI-like enzyme